MVAVEHREPGATPCSCVRIHRLLRALWLLGFGRATRHSSVHC